MKQKQRKSTKTTAAGNEYDFDDCVICTAMRFAEESGREPTLDELQQAFRKAEKQGAVVGTAEDLIKPSN